MNFFFHGLDDLAVNVFLNVCFNFLVRGSEEDRPSEVIGLSAELDTLVDKHGKGKQKDVCDM